MNHLLPPANLAGAMSQLGIKKSRYSLIECTQAFSIDDNDIVVLS